MVSGIFNRITRTNPVFQAALDLTKKYDARDTAFKAWYELVRQDDKLAQTNMESFVTNDPRTTWNMANYLLQPKPMSFQVESIDGSQLSAEAQDIARIFANYFALYWRKLDENNFKRLKQGWFWHFIGLMLTTGWFAVPNFYTRSSGMFVDYWNPATVYPEPSDNPSEGLLRVARVRTLTKAQAINVLAREGWTGAPQGNSIKEYQLWTNDNGVVSHGVSFDHMLVKPLQPIPQLTEIPILVGVVGGLPDDGAIDSNYLATAGQSILATNEKIIANYNRQQTYIQQLLRDVANPRVKAHVQGGRRLNLANTWYGRGTAFYELAPQEDIDIIQQPAIPVELQGFLIGMRNRLQNGSFSDLVYGNVMQDISSIIIAQAAEAALQLLYPFHKATQFTVSSITNSWYNTMLANRQLWPATIRDNVKAMPTDMLNTRLRATYRISIPGDLQNRINTARMLNPDFKMPVQEIMGLLFDEIIDPQATMAKARAEEIRRTPEWVMADLVTSFKLAADRADTFDDVELAKIYRSMAQLVEQKLTGQPTTNERLGNTRPTGALPTNIPPILQSQQGGTRG